MSSWEVPKPLGYIAATAAAIVSIGGSWKFFDLPVPASRQWVQESLRPYHGDSINLLHLRRTVALNELFLWESNPQPHNSNIRLNIDRLKQDIIEIERQIAARR